MYVVKDERRAVWRRKATDGMSQEPRLFAQHDVLFRWIGLRTDAIAVGPKLATKILSCAFWSARNRPSDRQN